MPSWRSPWLFFDLFIDQTSNQLEPGQVVGVGDSFPACAAEREVAVSGHTFQPGEVVAYALVRMLGHGEELLHVECRVLVMDRELLHTLEQRGLVKCEVLAPRDSGQAGG